MRPSSPGFLHESEIFLVRGVGHSSDRRWLELSSAGGTRHIRQLVGHLTKRWAQHHRLEEPDASFRNFLGGDSVTMTGIAAERT